MIERFRKIRPMQTSAETNVHRESEKPIAYFVGDPSFAEFRDAFEAMRSAADVRVFETAQAAACAVEEGVSPPVAIVMAQDRPDRRSHDGLRRWTQAAPISRVILLLGSWCDGELRTGRPWPGATRIHWTQFDEAVANGILQTNLKPHAVWNLPVTVSEEERILLRSDSDNSRRLNAVAPRRGAIVVCGKNRATTRWLADACRTAGYTTAERKPQDSSRFIGAKAILFDCNAIDDDALAQIGRCIRTVPEAPLFVLANFPRIEDVEAAKRRGATAVIPKPLGADDLIAQIEARQETTQ